LLSGTNKNLNMAISKPIPTLFIYSFRTSPALIQAPAPQLLGVQPLLSPFPSVQRFAAVPAKAQAVVAVQKSPATFSFSDAVSTQYFNYPNFGIAYEF